MIPFTDESPASPLLSTMVGNVSVLGFENASLDTLFGRLIALEAYISNDVGQHVSTSVVEYCSLRHSGLPN